MSDDAMSVASESTTMNSAYALHFGGKGHAQIHSKFLPDKTSDYTIECYIKPDCTSDMGILMWGDSAKICSINGIVLGKDGSVIFHSLLSLQSTFCSNHFDFFVSFLLLQWQHY